MTWDQPNRVVGGQGILLKNPSWSSLETLFNNPQLYIMHIKKKKKKN